ncbi:hypothetical protein CEXT_482091 [Caerostris extrusa]|uniref:Uncharacterized protein n=1 Tax=Caerostris extrusa TaxID=172846 RepID=A0AAV4NTT2_CAEEX|nr:hypothetical protein CEXT_482091 [Caerostris extrusa]
MLLLQTKIGTEGFHARQDNSFAIPLLIHGSGRIWLHSNHLNRNKLFLFIVRESYSFETNGSRKLSCHRSKTFIHYATHKLFTSRKALLRKSMRSGKTILWRYLNAFNFTSID